MVPKPMPLDRGVLVLAPHDDDGVLGAGGYLGDLRRRGAAVSVAVATDGALGYPRASMKSSIVGVREVEARRAYAHLGIRRGDIRFLRFPDMSLGAYLAWRAPGGRRGLYARLVSILRRVRPGVFLVPNPGDWHPDHRAAWEGARVAAIQAGEPVAADLGPPLGGLEVFMYGVWNPLARVSHLHRPSQGARGARGMALGEFRSQRRVVEEFERRPNRGGGRLHREGSGRAEFGPRVERFLRVEPTRYG
ncbi:MAG: PIG-L family deacetylase [Euryarchaeota archaeon]|nr:PIG-L family deacetylase [Euryarchaeota archaeon]